MITLQSRLIKKSSLQKPALIDVTRDMGAFEHHVRAMVGDILHRQETPEDADSLHVQYKKLGLSDYIVGSMEQVAKGAISAAKEALALDIKTKVQRIPKIEAQIKKKADQLNRAVNAKAQLAARSRARKDKELLPPFQNPFGNWVQPKHYQDGSLWFLVGGIHKKRPPQKYSSEYLFEAQYLDPRIRRLKQEIANMHARLHDLKGRLERLRREQKAGIVHICFGGKAHLRQRNEAKTPKEVETWRKEWHDLRRRELTLVGRKDSKCGNWMARYDIATHQLSYKSIRGRQVVIDGVHFPHGQQLVEAAVAAHDIAIRNKKLPLDQQVEGWKPGPVTWSIRDCGNAFLVKCMISVPADPHLNSCFDEGCVAFDMNYDHLAVAELDGKGCLLNHRVVRFRMAGRTSDQVNNAISEALEQVFRQAAVANKPIAMEDLDNPDKCLLYGNKKANRKISEFAHGRMTYLAGRKSQKYHLVVRAVNPAYTSQIGKLKYMRQMGLSVHEAAAYVIGRRAIGFQEDVPAELMHLVRKPAIPVFHLSNWAALYKATKKIPTHCFYRKLNYQEYKTAAALRKALVK